MEFQSKFIALICLLIASNTGYSATWSNTEIQWQHGRLLNPFSGHKYRSHIITYQHASGWSKGSNFYFIDYIEDENSDGFNDQDFYGEWYSTFSLNKIMGLNFKSSPINDVGIVAALNIGADANVKKYLPGISIDWKVPGARFFTTMLTLYLDDNGGLSSGGAPAEDDSWMLDISFGFPFRIGSQSLSLEGHVEYIAERVNELGNTVNAHVLAQPQIRWDVGQALGIKADTLFVGTELQYWNNKLGTNKNETTAQALVVWRL